jgi:hypothetical protein
MLEVNDARSDPVWRDGAAARISMIFYCGVPIYHPEGSSFGMFCILHDAPTATTEIERRLVDGFARLIHDQLKLEIMNQSLAHAATMTRFWGC